MTIRIWLDFDSGNQKFLENQFPNANSRNFWLWEFDFFWIGNLAAIKSWNIDLKTNFQELQAMTIRIWLNVDSGNQKFLEIQLWNTTFRNFWLWEFDSDWIFILAAISSWNIDFKYQLSGTFGHDNKNLIGFWFWQPKVPGNSILEIKFQELLVVRIRFPVNCQLGGHKFLKYWF